MKKGILVLSLCGLLLFAGCGSNNDTEKVMKCSRTTNQDNVKMDLQYEVTYKGKYVTQVKSTENVTSDDESYLETLEDTISEMFKSYTNLDHYDIKTKINGNTLTSVTTIDYDKIDTKKLLEIDSSLGLLIKDGKISIDDIKATYTANGIICE